MLRLTPVSIPHNFRLKLPEAWHAKILDFTSSAQFPINFIYEGKRKNTTKNEVFFIFRSKSKSNKKLALTEPVLQYFLAEKEPSSNEGLSFKEYLPIENSKLLITNYNNPSEVIPAKFELIPELVILNGNSMLGLNFRLNYLNGNGFSTVGYYSFGSRNYKWKFILHPDQTHMTDYEKLLCDTLIHKDFVERSCDKLIRYLEKQGAFKHAKMLRERARTHDNSKLTCEDEIEALSQIINDKSCLTDAAEQLSQAKINAIKIHWEKNPHHPEFYQNPIDMEKIDIMEMCCDWHARSMQYNNDFLPFVKKRQEERFHFPDFMFEEIWHYCLILASE